MSPTQPVVLTGFQEFNGGLKSLLTQALEHIKSQESDLTALKLGSLTLEGQTPTEVRTLNLVCINKKRRIQNTSQKFGLLKPAKEFDATGAFLVTMRTSVFFLSRRRGAL